MSTDKETLKNTTDTNNEPNRTKRKAVLFVVGVVLLVAAAITGIRGYQYTVTPAAIRQPAVDHYHFRTQIFYEGQPVNFADEQFQETYVGGQCSADLPETPIHFHDNTDQMTHIHWNGMTGGMMLKYYGLNLIGGPDDKLGWRFDSYLNPTPIQIRTDALADVPTGHTIYVFMNTDDGFKEKPLSEFLEQDLEDFFEKRSNLGSAKNSWYEWLLPKVQAHAGEDHDTQVSIEETSTQNVDLKQLNNLVGDVALFVQAERPSDQQVTEVFENLIELQESTCGG